jgi:hypothetical protein
MMPEKQKIKLPFWFKKLYYFEFWPAPVLYFPVLIYLFYLSIKARSFTFFTLANPGIFLGGIKGESKMDILKKISPTYLPKSVYLSEPISVYNTLAQLEQAELNFPIVIKPDVGERGKQVEKIDNEAALVQYFQNHAGQFICQEYIDYPIELGVLFYQFPKSNKFGISSIVQKEFLQVTGDNIKTLKQLILESDRAQLQLSYLLKKFEPRLSEVIPYGQVLVLEPIGNHCRGTTFLSGQHLISSSLEWVFKEISKDIPGFCIGRFDLKVKSLDDFAVGKNIRIMELNGIASEPAHIYHPGYSIVSAYSALFNHARLIYEIALENKKQGFAFLTFKSFYAALKEASS